MRTRRPAPITSVTANAQPAAIASNGSDFCCTSITRRKVAMSAISNGLALHGGFIPYDATFLVFSDYARNAVRMAAIFAVPSKVTSLQKSLAPGN